MAWLSVRVQLTDSQASFSLCAGLVYRTDEDPEPRRTERIPISERTINPSSQFPSSNSLPVPVLRVANLLQWIRLRTSLTPLTAKEQLILQFRGLFSFHSTYLLFAGGIFDTLFNIPKKVQTSRSEGMARSEIHFTLGPGQWGISSTRPLLQKSTVAEEKRRDFQHALLSEQKDSLHSLLAMEETRLFPHLRSQGTRQIRSFSLAGGPSPEQSFEQECGAMRFIKSANRMEVYHVLEIDPRM